LDSFEANCLNWTLPWTLACILVLQIMIFLFEFFFEVWTNWFSFQNHYNVGLASICHFLVLDPHLKAMGLVIYGSHLIELLYFIGPCTLHLCLKWWPMQFSWAFCNFYTQKQKFGDCIALHCPKP
jgi:hypothetical protein